jgi:hypothetical protein
MGSDDVDRLLAEYRSRYAPLITVPEAAEIARHESPDTIYDWSSRRLLDHIKVKVGRRVLFDRDGFVLYVLKLNQH